MAGKARTGENAHVMMREKSYVCGHAENVHRFVELGLEENLWRL